MRRFHCHCGAITYFENTTCLKCGRMQGFISSILTLSAFEPRGAGTWTPLDTIEAGKTYRMCANYDEAGVCNWMVPVIDNSSLCASCRMNKVIPNLLKADNRLLWFKVEQAKRRLLFTLFSLGLPIVGRDIDPDAGLAFSFKEDDPGAPGGQVFTGHYRGSITINIKEADPSAREEIRKRMNERYRTVLGHFRHEIGHYYWDRLVDGTHWVDGFRDLFGDERADYSEELRLYYQHGPRPDWEQNFISAYATSHPWEDWSETFSHYLHMMDTIETAYDYGFAIHGERMTHPSEVFTPRTYASGAEGPTFAKILEDMISLTLVMNALNRSMGMPDPYPFALTKPVVDKLHFVHDVVCEAARPER